MLRSVVSKVMWVGRATIFMVGLAVVLFLTLAIVAQAADARVPSLKKGVVNTVKTMTTLVGSIAEPILKLDNDGAGTALQLEVEPGNAPLVANADSGTATNLSADKLDGKDESEFASAYKRTVVVSPVGTDTQNGTALLNALSGITDASAAKPYLLKIEPGVYDLGNGSLQMKEHVDIAGSGELTTVITSGVTNTNVSGENCPSTVAGANDAELRFLTVRNTGTGECNIAIQNKHVSTRLTDVTVESTGEGAGTLSVGVHNYGGCITISDATVTASDWGVFNEFSSDGCFHLIKQSKISGVDYAVYHSASGGTYVAHSQLESLSAEDAGGGGFRKCFSTYDENFQAVGGC